MTPRRLALAALLLVAIAVALIARKPVASSGHWEPDDGSWDDEGLWSRVAGRMAP